MPTADRRNLRPLLLVGIIVFIITQIVAFSPASLEEENTGVMVDQEALIPPSESGEETTLATGIPKTRIPEYSIDGFFYVSTQDGVKQWKLKASKAYMYNKEKLVHARQVTAYLYDADDKFTIVTGNEAKYFMNERDLEVYGNVTTKFPDGFETHSEYMRYRPNDHRIVIPDTYFVEGGGQEEGGQKIHFTSFGLDFAMAVSEIVLPKDVKFTLERLQAPTVASEDKPEKKPDITTILSDHCVIYRAKQIAHFTMYPERPLETRFVEIHQPTLFARGRRADVNYGDFSKLLNYMTAYEDVLIKETGNPTSLRYGTGGRADFDTKKDVIVLREFPQVYQDEDTVTGDIIIVHRDTDVVEVEHSNAFSQGNNE